MLLALISLATLWLTFELLTAWQNSIERASPQGEDDAVAAGALGAATTGRGAAALLSRDVLKLSALVIDTWIDQLWYNEVCKVAPDDIEARGFPEAMVGVTDETLLRFLGAARRANLGECAVRIVGAAARHLSAAREARIDAALLAPDVFADAADDTRAAERAALVGRTLQRRGGGALHAAVADGRSSSTAFLRRVSWMLLANFAPQRIRDSRLGTLFLTEILVLSLRPLLNALKPAALNAMMAAPPSALPPSPTAAPPAAGAASLDGREDAPVAASASEGALRAQPLPADGVATAALSPHSEKALPSEAEIEEYVAAVRDATNAIIAASVMSPELPVARRLQAALVAALAAALSPAFVELCRSVDESGSEDGDVPDMEAWLRSALRERRVVAAYECVGELVRNRGDASEGTRLRLLVNNAAWAELTTLAESLQWLHFASADDAASSAVRSSTKLRRSSLIAPARAAAQLGFSTGRRRARWLTASVDSYSYSSKENEAQFVRYRITCCVAHGDAGEASGTSSTWDVDRRFSEFYKVHAYLKEKLGARLRVRMPSKNRLQLLPFQRLSSKNLRKRRLELDLFLKDLLDLPALRGDKLRAFPVLTGFLGLAQWQYREQQQHDEERRRSSASAHESGGNDLISSDSDSRVNLAQTFAALQGGGTRAMLEVSRMDDTAGAAARRREALVAAASPDGEGTLENSVGADDVRELVRSAWDLALALELNQPRTERRTCGMLRRWGTSACCAIARLPLGALLFSLTEGVIARYVVQGKTRAASAALKATIVRGVSVVAVSMERINANARERNERRARGSMSEEELEAARLGAAGAAEAAEAAALAAAQQCVDARRNLVASARSHPVAALIDSEVLVRAARLAHEFAQCETLLQSFVAECLEHIATSVVELEAN